MSKKILALTIIASLLLSLFIGIVQADEVATSLDELNEAIAEGGIVTLGSDIEGEIVIPEGKEVVLDLAGFELKSTSGDTISNHGTLTIKGNGKVTALANGKGAIVNYSDGNVTIENGTIYAESWYSIKNMGVMTINGGNISKGTNGASVIANGWYGSLAIDRNTTGTADTAILTIEGGTFFGEGSSSTIVKNDDYGILVINGGELTSSSEISDINAGPVVLNWHDATINGGILTSTNGAVLANGYLDDAADKGEMVVNGGIFVSGTNAELLAVNGGATENKGSLEINDGSFAGKFEGATPYGITIKGGSFSEPVPEDKLDESLIVELKRAGETDYPYSYYATVEEALENAEVGDEINGEVVETTIYTITLNYNHDEIESEIVEIEEGQEYEFQGASREGYTFNGWRKDEETVYNEGEKITVTENLTLIAEWTKNSSSGGSGSGSTTEPIDDEPQEQEWENPYKDIKEDKWYFEAVKKATESKLFNGMKSDEFKPEENMTRGMVVTVLYRLSGEKLNENATFDDVEKDAYYSEAIAWAAKNKIVLGTGNNKFEPDENVTREDLATMIYRYAQKNEKGYENGETFEVKYSDKNEISEYAMEAISWCTENQILEGKNENIIDAKGNATRAEAAKMFVKLMEVME